MNLRFYRLFWIILVSISSIFGQEIHEYVVHRTEMPITVDGRLDESSWVNAALTEKFVHYQDGAPTQLPTQCKLLWDDQYLYVGFICDDPDVWATMTERDDKLWNGEVVEILLDPDGDAVNYIEIQVNPLGTVLDLAMDKPYSVGGHANLGWNMEGFQIAVSVDGTINDLEHPDTHWTCEAALPFDALDPFAPSIDLPPKENDIWRILLTRYDYGRTGNQEVEISSWDQTDSRGFHVPEKFGKLIFSDDIVVRLQSHPASMVKDYLMIENYPNPFNASTIIHCVISGNQFCTVEIYDVLGRKVRTLIQDELIHGSFEEIWDGKNESNASVAGGIYYVRLKTQRQMSVRKIILLQ